MFYILLKKELKNYFKSIGNLIFVFALPILLILLMSSALKGYMNTDFQTFDNGAIYVYYEEKNPIVEQKVEDFRNLLMNTTGVVMNEIGHYGQGVEDVNSSKAFGIIRVKEGSMEYYRSPYNEPNGGKIVHSLFEQTMAKDMSRMTSQLNVIEMTTPPVDSSSYATFTYLALVIMFISLMTCHSIHDERTYGTIERINISKAGIHILLWSKVVLGLFIAVLQIAAVWLFSTYVMDVDWGVQKYSMFLILLCLAVMSSVFGVVIGMVSKNKSIADNTILMAVMLSGYIGGALSPVYLLENAGILNQIVKISPLYWAGRALSNLYVNIVDNNTYISMGVSLGLAFVFLLIYKIQVKKVELKI